MALVLNGCRLDIGPLCQELKLDPKDGANLVRQLGCKVAGKTAVLKVPLEFPVKAAGKRD